MKLKILTIFIILILSVSVKASQESDYLKFFKDYQSLGDNFDTAVIQLYSDDANIIVVRKMPDGVERTLKIDGLKWKQMIADTMEIAKQRGDKSEFSDIKVVVEKDKAKITA